MAAVLVSGHLIDAPDRRVPRFPQHLAGRVATLIGEVFEKWAVGPDTVILCGGARGTDIIAAEHGLARGAHIIVCLAMPPDAFEAESVALPGTDWSQRYRRLLAIAEVRQLPGGSADDPGVFARVNQWMVTLARELDPRPHALFVWDGKTGDGPGGTYDTVDRLGYAMDDPYVAVIDPTAL